MTRTSNVSPSEASQRPRDVLPIERLRLESDFRRRPSAIDQFESYKLHKVTFILMVLLPVLGVSLYYGLWASDQYSAEIRFSVRQAVEPIIGDDALTILAKGLAVNPVGREPYMVANYVRSRNMVEQLDQQEWLRSLYAKPTTDFFARFSREDSGERLWKYWQRMVNVSVDRISGLVTIRVLAFTPDDALTLVKAIQVSAESMIDQSSLRARTDELRLTVEDLSRARERYADALLALRQVREDEGTVDPEKTISATAETLISAMRKKLALERDRNVDLRILSRSAPQLQILNQQLQALDDEVGAINRSLTSRNESDRTAADSISRFEQGELERRFSEKLLEISQASYERARLEAERQHIYLATFVDPVKPDKAEYPKRLRAIALVSVCAIVAWGITLLVIAAIRDHELIS
jgi:capsular polysaccharide transport system permease protein